MTTKSSYKTLREGDRGSLVSYAQELLAPLIQGGLKADGDFGPKTEHAVSLFQEAHGLYDDGILGPRTWATLLEVGAAKQKPSSAPSEKLSWVKVPADPYKDGYSSHRVRSDFEDAYRGVLDELHKHGALLTSSGSRRSLNAKVKPNRSATSLHYLGRAIDLFVWSGMGSLEADPYLVERDPQDARRWIVWAKATDTSVPSRVVQAWYHKGQKAIPTEARVLNLTEILGDHGYEAIKSRRSYKRSNYGAAEWWHFQNTRGLVRGQTTFGSELERIYTVSKLKGTAPWKFRKGLWLVDWF